MGKRKNRPSPSLRHGRADQSALLSFSLSPSPAPLSASESTWSQSPTALASPSEEKNYPKKRVKWSWSRSQQHTGLERSPEEPQGKPSDSDETRRGRCTYEPRLVASQHPTRYSTRPSTANSEPKPDQGGHDEDIASIQQSARTTVYIFVPSSRIRRRSSSLERSGTKTTNTGTSDGNNSLRSSTLVSPKKPSSSVGESVGLDEWRLTPLGFFEEQPDAEQFNVSPSMRRPLKQTHARVETLVPDRSPAPKRMAIGGTGCHVRKGGYRAGLEDGEILEYVRR